jgi:hypothetical protein
MSDLEEHNGLDSSLKMEERTADYKFLLDYGLDPKVADRLDDIYKTGRFPPIFFYPSNFRQFFPPVKPLAGAGHVLSAMPCRRGQVVSLCLGSWGFMGCEVESLGQLFN